MSIKNTSTCTFTKETSYLWGLLLSKPVNFNQTKTKLKNLIIGFMFLAPLGLMAQQDPSYTHFAFNRILFNPAYAGASESFCINAVNHQQYRGLDEPPTKDNYLTASDLQLSNNMKNVAPFTTGFGFSAPINIKNKLTQERKNYGGIYFGFIDDKIAYEKNTYIKFGAAGALPFGNGQSIRLGFEYTSLTKSLDASKFKPHQPLDPNIPSNGSGVTNGNLGFGVYYQNENFNKFYVGLSNMLLQKKDYTWTGATGASVNFTTARHFYLISGMQIDNFLGNPRFRLDPALLLKAAQDISGIVRPQIDLQGMFVLDEKFAGGLATRTTVTGQFDAVSLMLGYYPKLKSQTMKLRVGYAYDIPLLSVGRLGTHEIQVNFCFDLTLPPPPQIKYRHPRWMDRDPDIE